MNTTLVFTFKMIAHTRNGNAVVVEGFGAVQSEGEESEKEVSAEVAGVITSGLVRLFDLLAQFDFADQQKAEKPKQPKPIRAA